MDHEEGAGNNLVRWAQPVVLQSEKLDETSSSAFCCIPSGVFRPLTSMRGGSKLDNHQRNVDDTTGDQPTRAGQRPSQDEGQIRAYFFYDCRDTIGLTRTDTKLIMVII